VPAAQLSVQAAVARPVVAPYVPAGQAKHELPATSEYEPELQLRSQTLAPGAENAPSEQFVHALPATLEYFPAAQLVQGLKLVVEYWPGEHSEPLLFSAFEHVGWESLAAMAPQHEYFPSGTAIQLVSSRLAGKSRREHPVQDVGIERPREPEPVLY